MGNQATPFAMGLTDLIFNYYLPGYQMTPYALGQPGTGRGSGNIGVAPNLDPTQPYVEGPGGSRVPAGGIHNFGLGNGPRNAQAQQGANMDSVNAMMASEGRKPIGNRGPGASPHPVQNGGGGGYPADWKTTPFPGDYSGVHPWNQPMNPGPLKKDNGHFNDTPSTGDLARQGFGQDDFNNQMGPQGEGLGAVGWQLNTPFGFRQFGGPDVPHDSFGDISQLGQNLGAMTALSNPFMRGPNGQDGAVQNNALGWLGQGDSAQARSVNSGFNAINNATGGPVAGAANMGMMNMLSGNTPFAAEQRVSDSMFGGTANAAENNAFNMLMGDRQGTRQGAHDTMFGQGANMAQGVDMATMSGAFMDPNSNPFLNRNVDAAMNKVTNRFRDAIAPSTQAQFARAGAFGGSAHQQSEAMDRYNLQDQLGDIASGMFGQNYERERGRQDAAAQRLGGWRQNMLSGELGRQAGMTGSMLDRAQQSALAERGGQRQLLDAERGRQLQGGLNMASLNNSTLSMMPQLNQMRYQDVDALRQIGGDIDDLNYRNRLADFESGMNRHNYQEDVLMRLQQGLAPLLGSTGEQQGFSEQHAGGGFSLPSLGDLLMPSGS